MILKSKTGKKINISNTKSVVAVHLILAYCMKILASMIWITINKQTGRIIIIDS